MFYVYDIYDKDTTYHAECLFVYPHTDKYVKEKNYISCGYKDLNIITVGVFDSNDGVTEYYTVASLLNILAQTGVEIKGVDIRYYANCTSMRPNNIDAIKKIVIRRALADNSKDFINRIVAQKLVSGVEIGTKGEVMGDISSLIKGDTLEFPREVKSMHYTVFQNEVNFSNVRNVVVYDTFDFSTNNSVSVNFLCRLCERGARLVVKGDLHLTPKLFQVLKADIYVTGQLSMSSFSKMMELCRHSNSQVGNRKVYKVADSRNTYTIDFNNYKVTRESK